MWHRWQCSCFQQKIFKVEVTALPTCEKTEVKKEAGMGIGGGQVVSVAALFPTIRVRIKLKSTIFVNFFLEKNENKQKDRALMIVEKSKSPRMAHFYRLLKGSFTLAAADCRFHSRLCQCRNSNFSISLRQCNHLPHTTASNGANVNEP